MIIKRLTLHNFGVYASDNTFVFNGKKNVTLIGGMNGRGKTTFLEAVLLALYGSNSFAFAESQYKGYGNYLKAHINEYDGTKESFVELEFDMNEEDDNNSYIVTRKWDANKKYVRDCVVVQKNGVNDVFLTQNWSMFIESILPSALANFFFFDGEKIAELAESETSLQMKDSIKTLLGINVIDMLKNDLLRIDKRLQNEQIDNYSATQIEDLRIIREEKQENLRALDEVISEIEKKITETESQIEKKRHAFEAGGGRIADRSKQLYSERGSLSGRLEQMQMDFINLAATELPLAMVRPLIGRIMEQSSNEREGKMMQIAVDKISEMYRKYPQYNNETKTTISEFISFVKDSTEDSGVDYIFNLSDAAHIQGELLYDSQLQNAREKYKIDKEKQVVTEKRINEIDNYLAVDIDEKAIQRIYKEICKLENSKIELQVAIESKTKERVSVHGEFLKASTDFNRCVEHSLKTMEREDDVKRLKGYVQMAQFISDKYKLELQRAKVDKLAETMTDCCKKLLGKKNLIDTIKMDYETLDYFCMDKNGCEIPKNTLSAGEKQLMVVSMLWALGICSKKKLPVIIDTPLARLDSVHRMALIHRYFPNASDQTIILSTDVEIDKTYYDVIKKYVDNEFTLVYDEAKKQSIIESGYFKGVIG